MAARRDLCSTVDPQTAILSVKMRSSVQTPVIRSSVSLLNVLTSMFDKIIKQKHSAMFLMCPYNGVKFGEF